MGLTSGSCTVDLISGSTPPPSKGGAGRSRAPEPRAVGALLAVGVLPTRPFARMWGQMHRTTPRMGPSPKSV